MVRYISAGWDVGNYFFRGLVFMMLWNWFVVPAFQVPALSYVVSLGLLMVATLFTVVKRSFKKKESEKLTDKEELVANISISIVFVLILIEAFVVSLFI